MSTNVGRVDRQPQATTGDRWSQRPLNLTAAAPPPMPMQLVAPLVLATASFNAVLQFAAQHSGLDDQDIAEAISVCKGYMSRFMRGVAQQWAKRLVLFMRVTQSLAPLQWLADQMGCEVVLRDSRAAEVAALRQRLNDLERGAAA
jgi:hypothetical protein